MYEKTVVIQNKLGLHARPAANFVMAAKRFKSAIRLQHEGETLDGKSMIAILGAGLVQGTELVLSAEGEDEREAVDTLCTAIEGGLGE